MDRKRLEIIVGTFVLVGVILFAAFIFFIGGVYFFKSGYHLSVGFSYVSGISKGTPVRYAGVPVGEVVALETFYEEVTEKPKVVLRLWIKKGVIIRENTKIEIRGAFALSEAHLEISSEGLADGAVLMDGAYVDGIDPTPLDNLIREGEEIARILKEMLTTVTEFVTDDEIHQGIRGVIVNLGALTENLNKIIGSSEEEIKGIITNTESSARELHQSLTELRKMLDHISNRQGTVGKLVYDEELYDETLKFVEEIKSNPWKLLRKTKEKKRKVEKQDPNETNQQEEPKKKRRFLFF